MNHPKRWLGADGGATLRERRLLRAAAEQDVEPPDGAERAVWLAIAASLTVGAATAGSGSAAGTASAGVSTAGAGATGSAAVGSTVAVIQGAAAAEGTAGSAIAATTAKVGLIKVFLVGAMSSGL